MLSASPAEASAFNSANSLIEYARGRVEFGHVAASVGCIGNGNRRVSKTHVLLRAGWREFTMSFMETYVKEERFFWPLIEKAGRGRSNLRDVIPAGFDNFVIADGVRIFGNVLYADEG